jgi:hypothetical protein
MGADLNQVSILARREIEARILIPFITTMIKEIGEMKTLQIIESIIAPLAKESGANLAKFLGGNTLEAFAKGISLWTREDALQIEIIEKSPKSLAFNVKRCKYAEMYKELGIGELGKILSCNRDAAMIDGFNPKIKFMRTKTIMEGAPICDFRYEEEE